MPMRRPRNFARAASSSGRGAPSKASVPFNVAPSGRSPMTARADMVLPEPLSPMMPKRWPLPITKLTSSSTGVSPNETVRLSTLSNATDASDTTQPGVELVAQTIAREVECDDDKDDRDAGDQREERLE